MKPRLLLLFTADAGAQQRLEEAPNGSSAVVLVARNLRGALKIISAKGHVFDCAIVSIPQTREQPPILMREQKIPRMRNGGQGVAGRNFRS
jgi:hypothetical protein